MAAGTCSAMTPVETRLFLCMRPIPEEAEAISYRAEVPVWEAMERLEDMEHKGLVFAYYERGKPPLYHPIRRPLAPGA